MRARSISTLHGPGFLPNCCPVTEKYPGALRRRGCTQLSATSKLLKHGLTSRCAPSCAPPPIYIPRRPLKPSSPSSLALHTKLLLRRSTLLPWSGPLPTAKHLDHVHSRSHHGRRRGAPEARKEADQVQQLAAWLGSEHVRSVDAGPGKSLPDCAIVRPNSC